jgi:hypothetical protein
VSAWANPATVATIGAAVSEVSGASIVHFVIATLADGATVM